MANRKGFAKKTKARQLALQALYSWLLSHNSLLDIEEYFLSQNKPDEFDGEFFHLLLHEIPSLASELDSSVKPYLSREINSVDPIELCILRIASYELLKTQKTPFKVVINEALELAKSFGSEDSHKFINVVLDKLATQINSEATPN